MVYVKKMAEELAEVLIAFNNGNCPYCNEPQRHEMDYEDPINTCPNGHTVSGYLEFEEPYQEAIDGIRERFYKKRCN